MTRFHGEILSEPPPFPFSVLSVTPWGGFFSGNPRLGIGLSYCQRYDVRQHAGGGAVHARAPALQDQRRLIVDFGME